MGRQLHSLLFAYKKMTPLQVELWVTERQLEYRMFGLTAALLESIPILGMAFSIGNRVGAAMCVEKERLGKGGTMRSCTNKGYTSHLPFWQVRTRSRKETADGPRWPSQALTTQ